MRNIRKKWVQHIVAFVLVIAMLLPMTTPVSAEAATYQKGSKGTNVQYLQQNLTFLGFPTGGVDGSFGNNTKRAVIELQKAFNLPQDGIVNDDLDKLMRGAVSDIQTYLKYKGYYKGVIDGICGSGTKNALKKLQKEKGKVQNGIADYFILKDFIDDTASGIKMTTLREWVARLNGTYSIALESEYYGKYGEDYIKLFTEYPELLNIDESVVGCLNFESSFAKDVQEELKRGKYINAAVWEGFSNGLEVLIKKGFSLFGLSKDEVEQTTYDAIMALVSGMYYRDSELYASIKAAEEALKKFDDIYSFADENVKLAIAGELLLTVQGITLDEIEKIIDLTEKNWKGISKALGEGVSMVDYLVGAVQLYAMTGEYIKELQNVVKQPSVLYADLAYLSKEREKSIEWFLIEQLIVDGSAEMVKELLSAATGGLYGKVTDGLQKLQKFFVKAPADEQVQAFLLYSYCENLKDTMNMMRQDLIENGEYYIASEIVEKISNYEKAYDFYLCAIEVYYECVNGMAKPEQQKVIESDIKYLAEYNYGTYIERCIKMMKEQQGQITVTEKMDYLLEKIGVADGKNVYFTVNHQPCSPTWVSSHGCTNCNMKDIVSTADFIKVFGKISVENFPKQTVSSIYDLDHTGQSCFGFACFAQWYLYADSAPEDVIGECVKEVKFNKENMEKYVQPGDVIRVNGHSMLVYSIEQNGLMVIDCNWGYKGQLNCLIQKHLLEYNHTRYAGYTTYINRVTKTAYGKSNAGTYDIDTGVTVTYASLAGTKTKTLTVTATPKPTATPIPTSTPIPTVAPTATPVPTSIPAPTTTPIPEPVVSGWVKASECPAGATVVDTKWTYTYTERTESTSAVMDGWIREGERKEVVAIGSFDYATFPDTFDTSHAVYTGMYTNRDAVPVTDGATREIISDEPTGYVYWHYAYPVGGGGDAGNRIVGYYYNQNLKYVGNWCYATEFCAFKSTKNYTTTADNKECGGKVYKITDSDYVKYDVAKGSHWWYRFEYNTCTYQDVKTIYQYYRTSNQEATSEVYEGNGNSNVVKWIRYK